MDGWIHLVDFTCLIVLVDAIRGSSRRLLSFGYALGGFLLVVALGAVAALIMVPRSGDTNIVNQVLDRYGLAITLVAPIAAVFGAFRPARRVASGR